MATKKQKDADKQHAREMLLKFLKPGDTVYGIVRSVSRSGMSRRIDFYTFVTDENGKIDRVFLTGYISTLLGYPFGRGNRDGMRVDGCGMDMIFHVVMNLSYALHGFANTDYTNDAIKILQQASDAVRPHAFVPPSIQGPSTRMHVCASCGQAHTGSGDTRPYMTLQRAISYLQDRKPGYTLKSEQL